MQNDFLTELAESVLNKYRDGLDKVTIIFPNQRAGLFFTKAMSRFIEKPIWSPSIRAIEDFVNGFSNVTIADPLTLLLDLFEVYKEKTGKDESFDQFYFWGEMLIRDFDEIDRNLVNPEHLFTTIKNLKEIDAEFQFYTEEQKEALKNFWGVTIDNNSTHAKSFIRFWQKLLPIYLEFNTRLLKNGYSYQGHVYRNVCNAIDKKKLVWDKGPLIFAGFNALTESEEKILKYFLSEYNAEIYWDFDNYYFEDKNHEAGLFLRRYYNDPILKTTFSTINRNSFIETTKSIKTIASPQYIEQVKVAGSVINELGIGNNGNEPEKTVLVIPDESLLPNMMFNLPDSISKINITMGYPLRNASFYDLLDTLLELLDKKRDGKKMFWYNHQFVFKLLNHPFVQGISIGISKSIKKKIEHGNMIYVPSTIVNEHPVFMELNNHLENKSPVFTLMREMLVFLRASLESEGVLESGFEREFSVLLYKLLSRLETTFEKRNIDVSYGFIKKLLKYFSNSEKIPFTGEPLEGLQIMGLLETRNLDFDNVVILCVNEGSIPKSSTQHSFIPYNVRKAYGLLNPDSKDAIFSYLFYRLIQRAGNITLIYNTEDSYTRNSEPSRYIYQLKFDSKHQIEEKSIRSNIGVSEIHPVVLNKGSFVMERLKRFISQDSNSVRSLTASALNMYLTCPISFAYRYVYDIREREEVTEDLDASTFGNILHKVMEHAYMSYVGKTITKEEIEPIRKNIDQHVDKAFAKTYGDQEPDKFKFEGRNIIGREVILKFVRRIIENDMRDAPFKIIGLEKRIQTTIQLDINGAGKPINLKGIIDRIDIKDNTLRIIDYKSGKDESTFSDIGSLFDVENKSRNKAVFQTMLYAWMYLETDKENQLPVVSGLYNARELFGKSFDMRIKLKNGRNPAVPVLDVRDFLDDYRMYLSNLLIEIFDPAIQFAHHESKEECIYCKYSKLPSELN